MTPRAWIIAVCSALFAALLEASFMPFLPPPWREIRPVMQLIVLLIIVNRPRGALAAAAIAGFVLDIFQVENGAFAFGRFILIAALLLLISESTLTNRSVYATAALILAARLFDRVWMVIASFLGGVLFRTDIRIESWTSFGTTLLWDIGLISVAFICLALFTRRFLITINRSKRRYD
jgi:cell shape-determining protein MreD